MSDKITAVDPVLNSMFLSADIILSVSAVFVSLCALVFTIWQARQTVKHNKLSVRPFLSHTQIKDIDSEGQPIFSSVLKNSGIGPAVIKDFILLYNGEEVSKNSISDFIDFLHEIFGNDIEWFYSFFPDSIVAIDESFDLFIVSGESAIKKATEIDIIIRYKSIYGDEIFTLDTQKKRQLYGDNIGENND